MKINSKHWFLYWLFNNFRVITLKLFTMSTTIQLALVTIGYLLFLIGWGIYQGRKVKNNADYAIAGRNLPGWVAALSERATGESSWALLGLPGAAYAMGIAELWTAIGCVVGIITAWWLLAWRLRDEAEKYSATTFSEYLAARHGEVAQWIRLVSSSTIVFFFFLYVGAQFLGGGKTLDTMFGIKPQWGMLITALIIIPYTIYGGFRSVVYTDVVQALVMIFTLTVGPIVGFFYLANHPEVYSNSIAIALESASPTHSSLFNGLKGAAAGMFLVGGFSWFFGYLGGMPQLTMRFIAIKDARQAKLARNIGITWTIVAYIGAMLLGMIGLAIFGPNALPDREYVMPATIMKIFPPAVAALLITGAIAAMISTADSLLVLSSTELSENIVKPFRRINDEKLILRQSRIITALLAIIALAIAYISPQKVIFTLVSYVWAGIGCTFSVVILLTLFWKPFHGKAALTAMILGLIFTIVWISSGMDKVVTAKLVNFFFTLIVAVSSTYLIPLKK